MARQLRFRIIEVKVRRSGQGFQVDAWLLIHGQGKGVHFQIGCVADLPGSFALACADAYEQLAGVPFPDRPVKRSSYQSEFGEGRPGDVSGR